MLSLEALRALARWNPRIVGALAVPCGHHTTQVGVALEIEDPELWSEVLVPCPEPPGIGFGLDPSGWPVYFGPYNRLLYHSCNHLKRRPKTREVALALRAALDGYNAACCDRSRTRVVGILNVTPDSFSDGGRFVSAQAAAERAREMVAEGADWIDLGGESTRPGSDPVSVDEELRRVLPVLEELGGRLGVPISIDTTKAVVARRALAAGATIVNDVTALTADPDMASVVAEAGAGLVLMHMRGTPRSMQVDPVYDDVVADTLRFLRRQIVVAVEAGVPVERIWIDPGFGFGKTLDHNLELLRRLGEYASTGHPVLVGTSRKSSLGLLLGGAPPDQRLEATAATVAVAITHGARAVRVHDVRQMARVARVTDAIVGRSGG